MHIDSLCQCKNEVIDSPYWWYADLRGVLAENPRLNVVARNDPTGGGNVDWTIGGVGLPTQFHEVTLSGGGESRNLRLKLGAGFAAILDSYADVFPAAFSGYHQLVAFRAFGVNPGSIVENFYNTADGANRFDSNAVAGVFGEFVNSSTDNRALTIGDIRNTSFAWDVRVDQSATVQDQGWHARIRIGMLPDADFATQTIHYTLADNGSEVWRFNEPSRKLATTLQVKVDTLHSASFDSAYGETTNPAFVELFNPADPLRDPPTGALFFRTTWNTSENINTNFGPTPVIEISITQPLTAGGDESARQFYRPPTSWTGNGITVFSPFKVTDELYSPIGDGVYDPRFPSSITAAVVSQ